MLAPWYDTMRCTGNYLSDLRSYDHQVNCQVSSESGAVFSPVADGTTLGPLHVQLCRRFLTYRSEARILTRRNSGQAIWPFYVPRHVSCCGRTSSKNVIRRPHRSHACLRRIALWDRKKYIVVILGILCLGHWALLYRTMFVVQARWEPSLGVCLVTNTNSDLLNVTFFFSESPLFYSRRFSSR